MWRRLKERALEMTTGGTGEKGGRVRVDSLPSFKIRKPGQTAGPFIHCKKNCLGEKSGLVGKDHGFCFRLAEFDVVGDTAGEILVTYSRHKSFLNFLNRK